MLGCFFQKQNFSLILKKYEITNIFSLNEITIMGDSYFVFFNSTDAWFPRTRNCIKRASITGKEDWGYRWRCCNSV